MFINFILKEGSKNLKAFYNKKENIENTLSSLGKKRVKKFNQLQILKYIFKRLNWNSYVELANIER